MVENPTARHASQSSAQSNDPGGGLRPAAGDEAGGTTATRGATFTTRTGSTPYGPTLIALLAACLLTATRLVAADGPDASSKTPSSCFAEGTVVDPAGLPVPGVVVAIDEATVSVVTDQRGRYCLPAMPGEIRGGVTIVATLDGFAPAHRGVPAGPPPRVVDLHLEPSTVREQVVVTPTRTSRRLGDVPVRTEVVGAPLIRAIGARTLADAVEFTTGVRVESNCQNCNFSELRLLGLGGPYTQILIDGQPVISSLAQVYGIEQIPARMIERIEVVKGGGSALYGSGAVGGVVNVISREPARTGALAEIRLDTAQGLPSYSASGSADWVSRDRQTLATGFVQSDGVRPLDVDGDGFTEVSRRRLDAMGGRFARYALSNRAKLTVEAMHLGEERRGGDLLRLPPDQANIAEWVHTRRSALGTTWFHAPGPRLDYRITAAGADTARDSYYGTAQDPNAFGDTQNRLWLVDTQANQYVGRHTVSWGAQFSWEALRDRQPAYGRLTRASYQNAAVFLQDEWAFGRGWSLLYGARADRHTAVGRFITSPRFALMYSPGEALDIRASIASGFRAPQVFDEDLHLRSVGGEMVLVHLSPGLKEETSTNSMIGAEWKPALWHGQALLEANAFSTSLHDLFHISEANAAGTEPRTFLKHNFGRARVHGVELNAGWGRGDTFVVQGGVVVQRARFAEPEPDFGSRDFFRTPRVYGNLTFTWRHPRYGDWFAGLRYTGSMKAPHYAGYIDEDRLEATPSFVTLDATASWPLYAGRPKLALTLGGRNLTNAYQEDLDRGPLRDASYVYGPRFPRSVVMGLRVEY